MAGKPPGELFARAETPIGESPLPEMSLAERIAADYRASGLTVGPHPMALRRDEMRGRGVVTVREYLRMPNGSAASVAGAVITRQRPGTAKGFFFLTVEDETGIANAIISPQLFDLERRILVASPMIIMHGVVQHQDGVTSLKVVHAEPIGPVAHEDVKLPEGHNFR
jgi:error-prone DNA polymerase